MLLQKPTLSDHLCMEYSCDCCGQSLITTVASSALPIPGDFLPCLTSWPLVEVSGSQKLIAACRPLSITIAAGSALPIPGTPLPRITSGIKPLPLEGASLGKGHRDSLDMRFASLSLIQVVGSSGSVDSEISAGTVSSVAPRWEWLVLA